jgi:hypothetical protein
MRYSELFEHYVNAFDVNSKEKYADQVWAIMVRSYEKLGGFHTAANIQELIQKTGLWKLCVRDDHVFAAMLYKDQNGRKSIASGTDGSSRGKRDYMLMKDEDVERQRAWAEVSGPAENVMKKSGAQPVPNTLANVLTGKEILELDPDGYHYDRLISGHRHTKIIYGFVNLDKDTAAKLVASGVDLHTLPSNIKLPK